MRPGALAGIASIVSAVGAAALYLSFNDWFGAGDLPAMLLWSLPLGGLVSFVMRRAVPRFENRQPRTQSLALAIIGVIVGFLWTFLAALILGAFIGAFSFPVLYCWMLGGLLGGVAAARFAREDISSSRTTAP